MLNATLAYDTKLKSALVAQQRVNTKVLCKSGTNRSTNLIGQSHLTRLKVND